MAIDRLAHRTRVRRQQHQRHVDVVARQQELGAHARPRRQVGRGPRRGRRRRRAERQPAARDGGERAGRERAGQELSAVDRHCAVLDARRARCIGGHAHSRSPRLIAAAAAAGARAVRRRASQARDRDRHARRHDPVHHLPRLRHREAPARRAAGSRQGRGGRPRRAVLLDLRAADALQAGPVLRRGDCARSTRSTSWPRTTRSGCASRAPPPTSAPTPTAGVMSALYGLEGGHALLPGDHAGAARAPARAGGARRPLHDADLDQQQRHRRLVRATRATSGA